MASDPLVGQRIGGRWLLKAPIARGGMSTVYHGQDELEGEHVAIKILRADLKPELRSLERFQREARIASRLGHANIVTIYSHGQLEGGLCYLVMEYIDGVSLQQAIWRQAPFGVRRTLQIGAQIADALAHAHEQQVLHRDLKPGNVLLVHRWGEPDLVKVLDFGLAKIQSPDEADTLTRAGLVFGTPEYISPEQACGQELDGRCDVYACGAILFEMLVGRPPFVGKGVFETLRKQVIEPAPTPSQARSDIAVPAMVEQIVLRCLEKLPENRFSSAAQLGRALRAVGRHLSRQRSTKEESAVTDSQMPTMGQDRVALLDADEAARAEYEQLRRHRQETLRRAAALLGGHRLATAIQATLGRTAEVEQHDIDLGAELAVVTSTMEETRAGALDHISQLRLETIDKQMEATTLREQLEHSGDDDGAATARLVEIGEALEALERRLYKAEQQLARHGEDFKRERKTLELRLAETQATVDGCYDELAALIRDAVASEPPPAEGKLVQLLEDLDSFDQWIAGHQAIIRGT